MKITKLRKAKQITQADLAQRCATSQQQIAKIEGGTVDPRLSTLRRIAQALDCNLHDLFYTPQEFLQELRHVVQEQNVTLSSLSMWDFNSLCERVADVPRFEPLWERVSIKGNKVQLKE